MRTYRGYTDKDIITEAAKQKSMGGLLKALGLKPVGGNYINMKKNLQRLDVDTAHWTGQAWNRGERLKDYSDYTRVVHLKKHLISERGHRCEECHISIWRDKIITLEVDHIDGDRTNNDEENLKLLCPNCHSQTPTWRNRKGS